MPSREIEDRFIEAAMPAIVADVRAASVRLEDAEDAAQIAALALLVWLRRQPEDGPMPEAAAPFVQRVASIACALVACGRSSRYLF